MSALFEYMALMARPDLDDRCSSCGVNMDRSLRATARSCEAVAVAHGDGVPTPDLCVGCCASGHGDLPCEDCPADHERLTRRAAA